MYIKDSIDYTPEHFCEDCASSDLCKFTEDMRAKREKVEEIKDIYSNFGSPIEVRILCRRFTKRNNILREQRGEW